MKAGQKYVAYNYGTMKFYTIKQQAGPVINYSDRLQAWQPYNYPALYCRVE